MKQKAEINGICDPQFEAVKDAFVMNFEEGMEVGASFAVSINGKFVVDIWGGFKDKERTQPWEKDTICNVYSTTKVPTVLCTLICVDRGLLDLDDPVAKYWPEFAQNGKEEILVRQILSHTSGLAGIEKPISPKAYFDWDQITSYLARQKPWWEPGTKSGYHAFTHGYILGELVKRVTGKTLGTFFKEEIAYPLNIDFHIGLDQKHISRVSKLISSSNPNMAQISLIIGGLLNYANTSEIVKKEIENLEKQVLIDFGGKNQITITFSKGKIQFKIGGIENPNCKFSTSKEKATVMNWLFSSFNDESYYISENLEMEGKPEEIDHIKKIFELCATEARSLGPVVVKAVLNPIAIRDYSGDREWQEAEIPAANGHGNARSVAKIASVIACEGELDGKRLITKDTLEKILEEQIYDIDLIMGIPIRWGLGVALPTKERPRVNPRTCYWGGGGGSAILMDLDAKIGFGYVMNHIRNQPAQESAKNEFHQDTRANRLIKAVYESLGLI